jgi:hypothetical protein
LASLLSQNAYMLDDCMLHPKDKQIFNVNLLKPLPVACDFDVASIEF